MRGQNLIFAGCKVSFGLLDSKRSLACVPGVRASSTAARDLMSAGLELTPAVGEFCRQSGIFSVSPKCRGVACLSGEPLIRRDPAVDFASGGRWEMAVSQRRVPTGQLLRKVEWTGKTGEENATRPVHFGPQAYHNPGLSGIPPWPPTTNTKAQGRRE